MISLKLVRRCHGVTQKQIATAMQVHPSSIVRLEQKPLTEDNIEAAKGFLRILESFITAKKVTFRLDISRSRIRNITETRVLPK